MPWQEFPFQKTESLAKLTWKRCEGRLADQKLAFVFIGTGPYDEAADKILLQQLKDSYPLEEAPDPVEANQFDQDKSVDLSLFFDDFRRTRIYLKEINIWTHGVYDKGGLYYFSSDLAAKVKAIRLDQIKQRDALRENER